ncbi:MAG TPA: choice-of-anchor Q domain-containing protein [Allocoleopsis sp.]
MAIITVTTSADSGAGSLRAAIASAQSGDTIQFAASLANQTIQLTSGQIEISAGKSLTIDGSSAANLTVSGNNASRIFLLKSTSATPSNLTLKNLTLANAYTADQGGAILTEHQAKLTVENVSFNNNVADNGGGAIFSAFEGSLTVTGSKFVGNQAVKGNDERGAGAIAFYGPGALTVSNSEFRDNKGINGAAINSLNGKLTIQNSKFINNDTTSATVDTGNPNPTLRGYGGAIYADRASSTSEPSGTIRILSSSFEGNKGRAEGGAAYFFTGTQDNVIIEKSSFKDNQVQALSGGNAGNGGAVTVLSNGLNQGLTISGSSFVNNTAANQGGGLWTMDAPTTITNSTFSGNTVPANSTEAYNRIGGGMALYSPTDIINTTIAFNKAGWVGGGVAADKKYTVTAKNTIFYNNTAENGGNDWKIQQQTSRELSDGGGNIQFPDLLSNQSNRFNDNRATANIKVIDPLLGALQDNGGGILTHALLAGSPAINAGVSAGAPGVDQRGFTRDSQIDAGAIEFGAAGSSTPLPVQTPTSGNDVITGTRKSELLLGAAGNDLLTGGLGADTQTGGTGADRFVYAGANQQAALAQSRVNNLDVITDFNTGEGDRIKLDFDNNPATIQLPNKLFNAGKVTGNGLEAAVRSAYKDKNQKQQGNQAIAGNEAVLLQWRQHTFLSVNDGAKALSSNRDLVAEVTGIQWAGQDATAGSLPVSRYFA